MACKPYQVEDVLKACREDLRGKALRSVALGWNFARYTALLDPSTRIQCIMPNTPALVREGVLLFEEAHSLAADERAEIMELFGALGMTVELPSALMGIGGAVAGCGPAFIDLLMEPAPRGSGLTFQSAVSTDDLDLNWQRLILTHLEEKRHVGVLGGFELTDVTITLVAVWAVRIPLTWLFVYRLHWGVLGLFLANMVNLFVRAVGFFIRHLGSKWYTKRV